MIDRLYRQSVLGVSDFAPVSSLVQRYGWKLGVGRFVAGETSEEAIKAIAALEARGMKGILDLLGEFVASEEGVRAMVAEIMSVLDALTTRPIEPYLSVKPTQLGLGLGFDMALVNARKIAERARATHAELCLDMENYPYVDGTLQLYETLHGEGLHHVSTVLQSYLKRSESDLERLLALHPKPTLRIVKGAYRESPEVAFTDKRTVDAQYRKLVFRAMAAGARANVATHDERIIEDTKHHAETLGLSRDAYEFQLLYGVRQALQARLVDEGYTVRIYVPYGKDWYGYFSRRLAERPANLLFVVRGLFG